MIIGGKKFNIGDYVQIQSAKSILHYEYGMNGNEAVIYRGLTGTIEKEATPSIKNCFRVAQLKVDEAYKHRFHNGILFILKDDELTLLNRRIPNESVEVNQIED